MADSSSDEGGFSEQAWDFYRDRTDWKDVTPVPQNDGPNAVVQISYSDKFRDVYDYFRAILQRNEMSERAFNLTTDAAVLNPANYTVWYYRRLLLKDLGKNIYDELKYIEEVIEDHPKNYQVWHHRRVLVEWLQDPSQELSMTKKILSSDAKNYHAWQHRQWTIREFEIWEGELDFIESLLVDDVRNNSAWNQRYFVINNTVKYTGDVVQRELRYTFQQILKAINNESSWNYLKGILMVQDTLNIKEVVDFVMDLYENKKNRSPYLLSFMVDLYEDQLQKKPSDSPIILHKALQLCNQLADETDTIRKEFWNFMARSLAEKFSAESNQGDPQGDSNKDENQAS
uniref:Protein farnesyltransferase/geranylgeranyltransferase type-1 subunit alpha n=1 Tax=Strigamia maritima TaxID=126957 RepID=T1IIV6_STRMM